MGGRGLWIPKDPRDQTGEMGLEEPETPLSFEVSGMELKTSGEGGQVNPDGWGGDRRSGPCLRRKPESPLRLW